MELVFNELSFFPLAINSHIVEQRFVNALKTFDKAKAKYDFTHIRFPVNYSSLKVSETQTFSEWINSLKNPTLLAIMLPLFKQPFVDNLEEEELQEFYQSEYKLVDEGCPADEPPIGIPVAFIRSSPTLSLNSHHYWNKNLFLVIKINIDVLENATFKVYNICIEADINSKELIEWADNSIPQLIETDELLLKFLSYNKFTANFSKNFMLQFMEWKKTDMNVFKNILSLMKDVELHPFTGGKGRTENLRYRGKEASKQISLNYRLSYSIDNNIVTFIACKGHYRFHD